MKQSEKLEKKFAGFEMNATEQKEVDNKINNLKLLELDYYCSYCGKLSCNGFCY